jgi:parvulin-like peptidyl-prolyl isomerase
MHAIPTPDTRQAPHRRHGLSGSPAIRALLCGLALAAFALAGCSANTGADPLLAARVNGSPITLAQYDSMSRFSQASAALQGRAGDLQSPSGRNNLNNVGQSAFTWLINRELARQQLAAQKLSITSAEQKNSRDFVDSYAAQIRQQLALQPDNAQLRELQDSLTPEVSQIIVGRLAGEQALADQSKFPTVHVRGIYVDKQDDANKLLDQVKQGADFGQLAHDKSQDSASAGKYGDLGTIYVGQISTEFSQQVFPAVARGQTPPKYVIVPVGAEYGLFEVTQPGKTAIAKEDQEQQGLQIVESWFSTVVQPQSNVEQYVTLR